MVAKRRLSASASTAESHHDGDDHDLQHGSLDHDYDQQPSKRHRFASPPSSRPASRDVFSTLSDELLLRVLSCFGVRELLDISLTSKRLHRLSADSQLWRAYYWSRFVRPRADRIPRFKTTASAARGEHKLNFDGQRSIWADGGFGRNSGLVQRKDVAHESPDWKAQYKMRHNWERGRCYVEELQLSADAEWSTAPERRTFAKFVDGLAVTVDSCWNLRAWDLRTRKLIAHADLDTEETLRGRPTCLSVDSQQLSAGILDVLVGFEDGTYGIWALDVKLKKLVLRYRHMQQLFGPVESLAYMHPYVLTARRTGFIVLYCFNDPETPSTTDSPTHQTSDNDASQIPNSGIATLQPPRMLDTVKSVKIVPQAVSIRKVGSSFVGSVAYSFNSLSGWCIGIQDLDIKPAERLKAVTSRLATTLPISNRWSGTSSPDGSPLRPGYARNDYGDDSESEEDDDDRPVSICYSHPYLLATMRDNTMMLHLCTTTATDLTISEGIRLWGHTSRISDAVVTPWGRAVSVTARGDEMRLWKVEGGFEGSSVEVRPRPAREGSENRDVSAGTQTKTNFEDKRTWVAFDEERVIALKEKPNGRESFMVYDFT